MITFGMATILTGVVINLELITETSHSLFFFVAATVVFYLISRKILIHFKGKDAPEVDKVEGLTCRVIQDIPLLGQGRVEFRGAPWSATNASETNTLLQDKEQCVIVRQEDNRLFVE